LVAFVPRINVVDDDDLKILFPLQNFIRLIMLTFK